MAVSRCPIDLHFVSLMVPVIAIIHLTVRGKKKGKKGKSCTPSFSLSLSRSLVSNKQATPLCRANTQTSVPPTRVCVSAFACARAYMIYRGNMRGCASFDCLCLPIMLHDQSLECARGSGGHV